MVMRVLESSSNLLNAGYRRPKWQARPLWVTRSRRSAGCIVDDEKGDIAFHTEFKHTHDVWMPQANQCLCFFEEALHFFFFGGGAQHFESSLTFEIQVFAEIDFGKASVSYMANEAV